MSLPLYIYFFLSVCLSSPLYVFLCLSFFLSSNYPFFSCSSLCLPVSFISPHLIFLTFCLSPSLSLLCLSPCIYISFFLSVSPPLYLFFYVSLSFFPLIILSFPVRLSVCLYLSSLPHLIFLSVCLSLSSSRHISKAKKCFSNIKYLCSRRFPELVTS